MDIAKKGEKCYDKFEYDKRGKVNLIAPFIAKDNIDSSFFVFM